MWLIMDNVGAHSDVSDPQVTVIELRLNTTAVYQPLDAGVIAYLKRRYKTRLLQRVVHNLDELIASGRPGPRMRRGGALDDGGQAHLMDAAKIFLEEWDAITATTLANCWLAADVRPVEDVAEVRRLVHRVQPVTDNADEDVSDLVALLANTALAEEFDGVTEKARAAAMRQWLRAENDAVALDETVEVIDF